MGARSHFRLIDFVSLISRLENNKEEKRRGRHPPRRYRGTSPIRNSAPLGPYSSNMPKAL
jgi:hypothetical protein